jgi:hypothetical protein
MRIQTVLITGSWSGFLIRMESFPLKGDGLIGSLDTDVLRQTAVAKERRD